LCRDYLFNPGGCRVAPNPDDDIDTGSNSAGRRDREFGDFHAAGIDIRQLTGINIVEVMMAAGVRIIKDPGRINDDFPDQAMLRKQSKRIVNRRLRYQVFLTIHQMHDLVSGEMLLTFQQDSRDQETLLGWQNAMFLQHPLEGVVTKYLFVSRIHHAH